MGPLIRFLPYLAGLPFIHSVHFGLAQNEPKAQGCGMPGGSECRTSDTDWNGPSGFVMANNLHGRCPILCGRSVRQLPLRPANHSEAGEFGLRFAVPGLKSKFA